jgi:hypothetical protein
VSGEILAIALRWQRRILIALAVLVLVAVAAFGFLYPDVDRRFEQDGTERLDGGTP